MATVPDIEGYSDLVQIARGGFAVVYRARQDRHDRVVALKVLNIDDLDDRARQKFERECRAMGNLSWHPNVVALIDSGISSDGHPYLVMEYLEAGSLGDRLKGGPLPWQESVAAGVQVAGALGAAHAAGTLHRDLKPENLLVGPFGEIKLGDFGIAAVEGAARTTTGHASFTANHVAPEILRRQPPSERSDLYSLASTLHTLIGGFPPFAGGPDEPIEAIITSVLTAPPPHLDGIPGDLASLLERTLAKDPSDRPTSAAEFGRELQRVQQMSGDSVTELRLTGTSSSESVSDQQALAPPNPVPDDVLPKGDPRSTVDLAHLPPTRSDKSASHAERVEIRSARKGRRRGGPIAVALLFCLVVAGGIGVLVSRSSDGEDGATNAAASDPGEESAVSEVTATIAVGDNPQALAVDDDSVWVTESEGASLSRIDIATNQVSGVDLGNSTLPITDTLTPGATQGIATTQGITWASNYLGGFVTRIDHATVEASPIEISSGPGAMASRGATATTVWVTNNLAGTVTRLDQRGETVATVEVGASPYAAAATASDVWVSNFEDGTVSRVDAISNSVVSTIRVGDGASGIAATANAVWVTMLDGSIARIDPATNKVVSTIDPGFSAGALAATDDAVWVVHTNDNKVSRIDPATEVVGETINVGSEPAGIAMSGEAVWVANHTDGTVTRIESHGG